MSDLNLGPAPETSRTKHFLIAVVAIALIVFAVVWFNPHHVSELAVTHVETFAPHTVNSAMKMQFGSVHVLGQSESAEDDLYVVATVRFKDTLRLPLDPMGASATLVTADNQSIDGQLVAQRDLPRLAQIFPNLAPLTQHPLSLERLEPGETREGAVVLLFPGATAKDWSTKKSATLTIRLAKQPEQTVAIP